MMVMMPVDLGGTMLMTEGGCSHSDRKFACCNSPVKMVAPSSQDSKEGDDTYTQARVKLERNLASPDKAKREKAMSLLCLWLTSQKEIKEEELLGIWKGLFYCLWHAEKLAAHADMIDRLAHLMERLDVDLSLQFFKVFLTALRREWGSIDKDCPDSFHLLLRQYFFHMFAILQKREWDVEVVKKFMDALVERALLAQDGVMADDVNLGITDNFLHELKHYLPIAEGTFEALLEPFWMALAKGCNKMVAERISEKVFLPLFDHGCKFLTSKQGGKVSEGEDTCFGRVALFLSFSIRTKSTALLPFTSESNIAQLNLIQEKFMCLENMLVQSHHSLCDLNGNISNVEPNQTESQSNADAINSLAESGERAQSCSISPLQFLVTRTFGRRSKRNQKLAFSPQTVDGIYVKENVSRPGNALEDLPDKAAEIEMWAKQDNMNPLSKNQALGEVRTSSEVTSSGKDHMDMASAPQQNIDNGDIIDIDGSPPKQDAAISAEDTNGRMSASELSEDSMNMEDSVISNLAKRFDSIADQSPCFEGYLSPKVSTPLAPSPINTGGRKRKSWRYSPMDALDSSPTSTKENNIQPQDTLQGHDVASIDNMSAKKAKKVHFSLQHNIVWKPSTPLPPHSLRVPPAATPRGSALKKGVPPGPILDVSEAPLVSPKKKKSTPRKAPSTHLKSPKSPKNSAKVLKPTKRGHLSPR
eukprot:c15979_g1_i1 orf=302-2401(+)